MWIVTLVHADGRNRHSRALEAFFNPRWSASRVREHVDVLHARLAYTPAEQLLYMSNRKRFRGYSAEINRTLSGDERITCGHNPWLEARKVRNFRLVGGASWDWDERKTREQGGI